MGQADLAAAIGELKAKPAGELQVHGSGALTRWPLENDLVDARGYSLTPARTWRLTWWNREPSRKA